ncbi:MAG TPA: hypothetical protein VJ622_04265 [Acidimicrobiia bacterium]|nr:hypothetical protein [Acidimicrobiia bacterium]
MRGGSKGRGGNPCTDHVDRRGHGRLLVAISLLATAAALPAARAAVAGDPPAGDESDPYHEGVLNVVGY